MMLPEGVAVPLPVTVPEMAMVEFGPMLPVMVAAVVEVNPPPATN